jgi:hypothetical protein
MVTKVIKAKNLTTRDQIVEQGKLRREGHSIAEVGVVGTRVEITMAGDFRRLIFGADDLVRVVKA